MRTPRLRNVTIDQSQLMLTYDTGEPRFIGLEKFINHLNDMGAATFEINDIEQSKVEDGILVFPSKQISLKTPQGNVEVPYDVDPFYLFEESHSHELSIGEVFREKRLDLGLSQDKVAESCGTDKAYISKFERNKIQVEWNTIRRLFYCGLGVRVSAACLTQEPIHTILK